MENTHKLRGIEVDARQVTDDNWEEIAKWACAQVVVTPADHRNIIGYLDSSLPPKIWMHLPLSGMVYDQYGDHVFSQARVRIGDWVVRRWPGKPEWSSYTDAQFHEAFDAIEETAGV